MTRGVVVFTPEAEEQLADLYRHIEENASPEVAFRGLTGGALQDFRKGNRCGHTQPDGMPPAIHCFSFEIPACPMEWIAGRSASAFLDRHQALRLGF